MSTLKQAWRRRILARTFAWLAISSFVLWALRWSEFDLAVLLGSGDRFAEFFSRLVPPDWSVSKLVFRSTIETLMIAIAGTAMAVVFSLPLGFLAASNVSCGQRPARAEVDHRWALIASLSHMLPIGKIRRHGLDRFHRLVGEDECLARGGDREGSGQA